ncbi:MAG: hypothetical protein NT029_13405 [Armatimonadetes bacterium]|nr:hypothetical protein [Armatimonadota bacterium]
MDDRPSTRRPARWPRVALSALALHCVACGIAVAQTPELAEMAVAGVTDLRARLEVTRVDGAAMRTISPDLAMLFGLKALDIAYKEPSRFRAEARVGLLLVDGAALYYRVPQLGIKRRTDLGADLHRRHSLFDLGLLTKAKLEQLEGRRLRSEVVRGVEAQVFELRYRADREVRYLAWLDPVRKVTLRRQWYDRSSRLKGTFDYLDVSEAAPGICVPRKIEVRTAAGALAGVAVYSDVVVNGGLADALFEIPADAPARPGG